MPTANRRATKDATMTAAISRTRVIMIPRMAVPVKSEVGALIAMLQPLVSGTGAYAVNYVSPP